MLRAGASGRQWAAFSRITSIGQRPFTAHRTACGSRQQQASMLSQGTAHTMRHSTPQTAAPHKQHSELISYAAICGAHLRSEGACWRGYSSSLRKQSHCSVAQRRLRTAALAAAASGGTPGSYRNKVVFLGTPEVAAGVLQQLLDAAKSPGADFEVAAVVTQPGRRKGRSKGPTPSPVAAAAAEHGMPADAVLTPESARDEGFLDQLRSIQPDLCVTAAYGNILPRAFLDIPRHGTLNIHPSLLPRWRGAAPVPRAIEAGDTETGVSVAFTVRAMDAGPVLVTERVAVDPDVQAPQLLEDLFDRGCRLLSEQLPAVWAGEAAAAAVPQDEAHVTHAPKMSKEEGTLSFAQPALQLHNKVRAFAGWPGTSATLYLQEEDGSWTPLDLKIVETRLGSSSNGGVGAAAEVVFEDGALHVSCGAGGVLKVLRLQPAGKKAMSVQDFMNGFVKGRKIWACTVEDDAAFLAAREQGKQALPQEIRRIHEHDQAQAGTTAV